jgi:hypothetical protein
MKKYIYSFIIIVFWGCSKSKEQQSENTILISVDVNKAETLKFSDYFTEITYTLLDDSVLISTIDNAKVYDDKLFIISNKSLIAFDINSGKVLNNIRRLGNGPGEYLSLYDMLYDKNENLIELLDMNQQKVIKYDLDNKFVSEFKTLCMSFSFKKIDENTYLFYNNNMLSDIISDNLICYDVQKGKITNSHFPIDKHLASYFFIYNVNNFGSNALPTFNFSPSNKIYGFNDKAEPFEKYTLDFGKHNTPKQFYDENFKDIYDFSQKADRRSYIYTFGDFNENNYIASFQFLKKIKQYWVFYEKQTKSVNTFDKFIDNYHTDIEIDINYNNVPFILDSEYFYLFLPPSQLIELTGKNRKIKNRVLDSIYHSPDFSEYSNPILIKCKFKNL